MRFVECLKGKTQDNFSNRTPVIAFLGDSVTQGCFEIYRDHGKLRTVFDSREAYSEKVKQMLSVLYPEAPVVVANFGINGDTAPGGASRFQRDVVSAAPDLLVVCYGLNDVAEGFEGIAKYQDGLRSIFSQAREAGIEIIFMTPNMMATYGNERILGEDFLNYKEIIETQREQGVMDAYMEAAREVCRKEQIAICDCYAIWKQMYESGVDVTTLLSNGINHPTREMHYLFASQLVLAMLNETK